MTNTLINSFHLNSRGVISLIGAGGKTSLMFRLAKELTDSGKTVLTTTTTKIFMPKPDQSPDTIIEEAVDDLIKKSKSCLTHCHHLSAGSRRDEATGKLIGFAPDIINQLWQADIFDWIIVEADGARRKPLKASDSHEPVIPESTTHLILVTGLDAVGKPLDENHVHRATLFSMNTGLSLGDKIDEQSVAACIAIEIKKGNALCHPLFSIVFLNKADTRDQIASGMKIAKLLQTNKTISRIITGALKDEIPVKDYFDIQKISGIILAAGSASRMGKTKQLLPFGKNTLLGQVIQNARESALHEIIVVLGHRADEIEQVIDVSGTKVVRNPDYLNGQSTSLIKGLENVSPLCNAAMFLLGDQPLVTAAIINKLIAALQISPAPIVIPYCNGIRGNPVIIARPLFHRLESLSGDTGPRVLFDEFKDDILKVPVSDEAILVDVDTKEDYEDLLCKRF